MRKQKATTKTIETEVVVVVFWTEDSRDDDDVDGGGGGGGGGGWVRVISWNEQDKEKRENDNMEREDVFCTRHERLRVK